MMDLFAAVQESASGTPPGNPLEHELSPVIEGWRKLRARVGRLAEIERWMSVEDLQAAEQQQGHADNPDPMGQSNHGRMPIYDLGRFCAVDHSGSQLRQLG